MTNLAFVSAILGMAISLSALTNLLVKNHDKLNPKSLSELAAAEDKLLRQFRVGLFICGSLFAISMYFLVLPRMDEPIPLLTVYSISYLSILLAALLPARSTTLKFHIFAGRIMGISMLMLSYLFAYGVHGVFGRIEILLAIFMTSLAAVTYMDKKHFAYYEIAYLGLNHLTIVIACISLL